LVFNWAAFHNDWLGLENSLLEYSVLLGSGFLYLVVAIFLLEKEKVGRAKANLYFPPLFWAGIIFTAASLPGARVSRLNWLDFILHALAHAAEFAVLSALIYRAIKFRQSKSQEVFEQVKNSVKTLRSGTKAFLARIVWEIFVPKKMLLAILITVVYAAFDELHQYYVPGRVASFWDFLFDSFGAVVGVFVSRAIFFFGF